MKSATITALAAILSAGAQAAPSPGHAHHAGRHAHLHHAKRDIYWVTEYEVETVTVLRTVYADGSNAGGEQTITGVAYTSHASAASPAPYPAPDTTVTTHVVVPPPATSSSAAVNTTAPGSTQAPSAPAPAPAPVKTSSTSVYVPPPAPHTSSSTSTYVAPPPPSSTSSAAAAPAPTATTYPGGGQYPTTAGASYSGDFTYYATGLGACGITSGESDHIVAISKIVFDQYTPNGNPNANSLCGRTVNLYSKDGTAYPAKVVDRCVDCAAQDVDMTQTLFNLVTNNGDGRVHSMKWSWQ